MREGVLLVIEPLLCVEHAHEDTDPEAGGVRHRGIVLHRLEDVGSPGNQRHRTSRTMDAKRVEDAVVEPLPIGD